MWPPTMEQFNAWSLKDKLWWINLENNGDAGAPGTPGFIFYKEYAIKYRNTNVGVVEPKAVSLQQAANEFERTKELLESISRSYN